MLEKQAAVERIRVLRDEIATLTEDINYYADVLDTKYVNMRHMYAARNDAWVELDTLTELVEAYDDATDWDSMAEDGRDADYYADAAGL
jgi:hypothetical protein